MIRLDIATSSEVLPLEPEWLASEGARECSVALPMGPLAWSQGRMGAGFGGSVRFLASIAPSQADCEKETRQDGIFRFCPVRDVIDITFPRWSLISSSHLSAKHQQARTNSPPLPDADISISTFC